MTENQLTSQNEVENATQRRLHFRPRYLNRSHETNLKVLPTELHRPALYAHHRLSTLYDFVYVAWHFSRGVGH